MKHIEDTDNRVHWTTDEGRLLLRKESDGLYYFPYAAASWRDLPEFEVAIEDAVFREQKRELEGEPMATKAEQILTELTEHMRRTDDELLQTVDVFRELFGHEFTPERLRLIAEVVKRASILLEQWEADDLEREPEPVSRIPDNISRFCEAVKAMKGGTSET